jgi:PIN domain nuclease of toxin-antitoxin system
VQLLLDTHTLLWWLTNNPTLAVQAKNAIADPDNLVFVSAASAWEIAIKKSLGKLQAPDDLAAQIKAKNFIPLAISVEHAVMVEQLPMHHQDPFDRILIAQGMYEQLVIITRDRQFDFYQVNTIKS